MNHSNMQIISREVGRILKTVTNLEFNIALSTDFDLLFTCASICPISRLDSDRDIEKKALKHAQDIVQQLREGSLIKTINADHEKEVKAFEKIIADLETELAKYRGYYELQKNIEVDKAVAKEKVNEHKP